MYNALSSENDPEEELALCRWNDDGGFVGTESVDNDQRSVEEQVDEKQEKPVSSSIVQRDTRPNRHTRLQSASPTSASLRPVGNDSN